MFAYASIAVTVKVHMVTKSTSEKMREFLVNKILSVSGSFSSKSASKATSKKSPFPIVVSYVIFGVGIAALLIVLWPLTLTYLIFYEMYQVEPARLYFQRTSRRSEALLQKCPLLLTQKYRPTPLTSMPWISGHLTTIVNELLRSTSFRSLKYDRFVLDLKDGGATVALDTLTSAASPQLVAADSPVMLIVPGLVGGSHSSYVRHYAHLLLQNGIRPVVLNARGCAGTNLSTPVPFNIGNTRDIHAALLHLKQIYPSSVLMGAGFSMGASLIVKYAGEQAEACLMKAVVSVACPFDWVKVNAHLEETWLTKNVYNFFLTKALVGYLRKHKDAFVDVEGVDIDEALNAGNLRDFDSKCTVPLFGFKDTNELYEKFSCAPHLANVKVPLLVIQALDDPIIPQSVIPYDAFERNPNLILATTKNGGHVAWMSDWIPGAYNFSDLASLEFFQAVLADAAQTGGHHSKDRFFEKPGLMIVETGNDVE